MFLFRCYQSVPLCLCPWPLPPTWPAWPGPMRLWLPWLDLCTNSTRPCHHDWFITPPRWQHSPSLTNCQMMDLAKVLGWWLLLLIGSRTTNNLFTFWFLYFTKYVFFLVVKKKLLQMSLHHVSVKMIRFCARYDVNLVDIKLYISKLK